MTATHLYLTRSEIFAAAWRRFRAVKGAKATPRLAPAFWAGCLRMAWAAAKGDAFLLVALRDEANGKYSRKPVTSINAPRTARKSRTWRELSMVRNFAA